SILAGIIGLGFVLGARLCIHCFDGRAGHSRARFVENCPSQVAANQLRANLAYRNESQRENDRAEDRKKSGIPLNHRILLSFATILHTCAATDASVSAI